jgi:hypothetical protein
MDDGCSSQDIAHIVDILRVRKNNLNSTILILGSRAGGLFRSKKLYETLKLFGEPSFNNLPPIRQFGECYRLLTRKNLPGFSKTDIDSILTEALRDVDIIDADIYLAQLVKARVFDIILTTNMDDTLETALRAVGMREIHDFEVLNLYAGVEKGHFSFKKNVPCHVVKIFGQLTTQKYIMRRSGYLSQYRQIRELLEEFLVRDCLVIALDPQWDAEIYQTFLIQGNPFWFVNEEALDIDTSFYHIVEARNARQFVGPSAHYSHFVSSLYFSFMKDLQPDQIKDSAHHQQKEADSDQNARLTIVESPTDIPLHSVLPKTNLDIFLSYAPRDEPLVASLIEHLTALKREKIIHECYSRKIQAGKVRTNEVELHLNNTDIVLLLVSASFLASKYVSGVELERAMQLHYAGNVHVIPIILRPVDWQSTPFGTLEPLPARGKPVTTWKNRDAAFLDIVRGIREVIEEIRKTP